MYSMSQLKLYIGKKVKVKSNVVTAYTNDGYTYIGICDSFDTFFDDLDRVVITNIVMTDNPNATDTIKIRLHNLESIVLLEEPGSLYNEFLPEEVCNDY